MTAQENIDVARRFFREQDESKGPPPEDLCATGYTCHLAGMPPMDLASQAGLGRMFWTAFPDLTQTVEEVFADDTHAAVRFTARGTHQGDLMGIPPSGKPFEVTGMATLRIDRGKIVEFREVFDQMSMMQQIGALPSH